MTDSGVTAHFPHESDMQPSIESRFNPSHSRTGIHDPSVPVAATSKVEKRTDTAMQFARSLITPRNAVVPISLLPPEILVWVFHLLVLEEPPLSGPQNLGWIRVTHVCRYWRQVALDDSSLWAKIWGITKNTMWTSEMLARAKNAPLDIELDAVAKSSLEALLMLPPHISHTRQLRLHDLSMLSTLHLDSVQEIYKQEAPALEHFELTVDPYSSISLEDLSWNMFFKGCAPRLRTFSLSRIAISWSLIPRGQLTQLKIACPSEDCPSDLNQLIDLLVNCPALEILALDSCLPSQLTKLPHDRTIHLRHLSQLRLCGSASRIRNMLKMLKLPSSTTLHLDCTSDFTSIHNDEEVLLLAFISAQFQSPAPVEFKSLTITIQHNIPNSLNITASTFPSTLQNRQTQSLGGDIVGNAELVLSFDWLSKPGHTTDLLEQACKMLPISSLEFISMSAPDIVDINWAELFSCCTNVTTMQAIGRGTSNLVRALTTSSPTVTNTGFSKDGGKGKHDKREGTLVQPVSTAHAAIFPKLKFLGLSELNFSEGEYASGILFYVFERGLYQRMVASSGTLKLLRIRDCDISTEYANQLKTLVKEFDWDGYLGSFYEEEEPPYDFSMGGLIRVNYHTAPPDWDLDRWEYYMDRLDDHSDEY